jgi:hypothetical protein
MLTSTISGLDLLRENATDMTLVEYKQRKNHPNYHCAGDEFQWMIPRMEEYAQSINFIIKHEDPEPDGRGKTLGLCRQSMLGWVLDEPKGTIYLHSDLSPNERLRVGIHELTHALGACNGDIGTDEITAESTTYLVCRELGLDTWNWSLPYISAQIHCYDGEFLMEDINNYVQTIKEGIL